MVEAPGRVVKVGVSDERYPASVAFPNLLPQGGDPCDSSYILALAGPQDDRAAGRASPAESTGRIGPGIDLDSLEPVDRVLVDIVRASSSPTQGPHGGAVENNLHVTG